MLLLLQSPAVEPERREAKDRVVEPGVGQQPHGDRHEGGADVHEQQRGLEEESQRLHIEEDPGRRRGDGRAGRRGRLPRPADHRVRPTGRGRVHSVDHRSHHTSKIHVRVAGPEER